MAEPRPEEIAEGVWRLTGDIKAGMNVYFLAEDGGVAMFDAGTKPMTKRVAAAAEQLGGLRRIVLGHSHTDHRGTAPGLKVPVYCHPDEVPDAQREHWKLDYWDISKVEYAPVRWIYPTLHRRWDGGRVEIADTLEEGDDVAGFEVIHFPGHAPGLIGLWRHSDALAIVSDTVYYIDPVHLKARDEITREHLEGREATVAHPAFNWDTGKARESLRKLAGLRPKAAWSGHEEGLRGDPGLVAEALERAAEVKFPERARDDSA
jgi:glyoxylase-like metal-dependent hydrolase (beta-lactamase superfamily II)